MLFAIVHIYWAAGGIAAMDNGGATDAAAQAYIGLFAAVGLVSASVGHGFVHDWELHDLWPEWGIPRRVLIHPGWQTKVAHRAGRAPRTVQVQIAGDMIARVRELTRAITGLYEQLAGLVRQVAPQLLAETGVGGLIAAKLIGEIAGIDRFTSDARLARLSGCAPIPVSSGRTDRHRLDPGGNRQLNHASQPSSAVDIGAIGDAQDLRAARSILRQRMGGDWLPRDSARSGSAGR